MSGDQRDEDIATVCQTAAPGDDWCDDCDGHGHHWPWCERDEIASAPTDDGITRRVEP